MEITVVRTQGAPDRFHVARDDGTEGSWSFPTYGNGLPHDVVHWVVECVFGLSQGFWGRVAAGVDVRKINEEANRRGGKDKYAGYGPDRREILLAEALAATFGNPDRRGDVTLADGASAALAQACETIGVETVAVTDVQADEVYAVLDALRARWLSLVPKGSLRMRFDVARPREGLSEWLDARQR